MNYLSLAGHAGRAGLAGLAGLAGRAGRAGRAGHRSAVLSYAMHTHNTRNQQPATFFTESFFSGRCHRNFELTGIYPVKKFINLNPLYYEKL